MTFKTGKSGNPKGRPKGALSRRVQLAKLLEPHAEELVAKMIELALSGDVNALRLCVERLIPKIKQGPIGIDLPSDLNESSLQELKEEVIFAVLEGRISADDAEKLNKLISEERGKIASLLNLTSDLPSDPMQAAKVYQQIMMTS